MNVKESLLMDVWKDSRDKFIIEYEDVKIPCMLKRSKRKSYGLEVDEEGNVTLKVPMRSSDTFMYSFLKDKSRWIREKHEKQIRRKEQVAAWKAEQGITPVHEEALARRYREAAKEYFPKRVSYYQAQMGGEYERIVIREQKTRWGSCSSRGTLSFNWRLMLAPPAVLDYVVVHELAHLQQMNHSKKFWDIVERVMPDYRSRRKWLKENGTKLQMQSFLPLGEKDTLL